MLVLVLGYALSETPQNMLPKYVGNPYLVNMGYLKTSCHWVSVRGFIALKFESST